MNSAPPSETIIRLKQANPSKQDSGISLSTGQALIYLLLVMNSLLIYYLAKETEAQREIKYFAKVTQLVSGVGLGLNPSTCALVKAKVDQSESQSFCRLTSHWRMCLWCLNDLS